MLPRLAVTFILAAFASAASLPAQTPEPGAQTIPFEGDAPAYVAHVEGTVSLEREGRAEHAPLNMPLLSGDRLRTGGDGRVEVQFADGSTLHLDTRSTIDVQSDDLVRLTDGRLRLNIQGPARGVNYRIDSPAGSARITQPGEYRIALLTPSALRAGGTNEVQLEVAVVRGAAQIFTDEGSTPVRAGERAYASAALAPSYAYVYNSATWDAFDRWSEARRDVRLGVSSQYLPADMQSYAPVLDQAGDWRHSESDGYAWYPRVTSDWRPYYYGRWASYPRYGWTWIGAERFAWPTHHYGRWGFSAGVWFWKPSSRWAPAYVSWGAAPGYVSWCPIGFDDRPVIGLDLYRIGPDYYSPWRAWTAVSYSNFGERDAYVHQRAVNWDRNGRARQPQFETRPSAPGSSRDVAVPRNAAPIRWAGSRSAPTDHGGRDGGGRGITPGGAAPPRDRAIPRAGAAASRDGVARDAASLPPSDRRSSGGDASTPGTAVPRYVNRGDEIVRSPSEGPTPRTAAPSGRTSDPAQGSPFDTSRASRSPRAESSGDGAQGRPFDPARASGSPRAESRGDDAQGRPAREGYASPRSAPRAETVPPQAERGAVERRPMPDMPAGRANPGFGRTPAAEAPVDRPAYQPAEPRGYDPRVRRPDAGWRPAADPVSPPAPPRDTQPPSYERPRGGYGETAAAPRPPAQERAAPPAPNRGEGRQPAADRAAPAERPAPAAPTGGVQAVPRRGGRGGA